MTDRTLFPLPPVLTDRQQQVLELLQANPAGLRSTDVGRYLHEARNAPCACDSSSPASTVSCRYAKSDGYRAASQLRKLEPPLAIHRQSGLWELLPAARPHDTGTFPDQF